MEREGTKKVRIKNPELGRKKGSVELGKRIAKMRGLVAYFVLGYFDEVTLKVLIHSAEEGGYWAEVPALPGCVSQAETIDELRSNVREAIEGWLLAEDATTQSTGADQVIEVAV